MSATTTPHAGSKAGPRSDRCIDWLDPRLSNSQGVRLLKTRYALRRFLGMIIKQTDKGIFLSQETYIDSIIRRVKMEKATPIYSPVDPHVMLGSEECEDKLADREFYLSIVDVRGSRHTTRYSLQCHSSKSIQSKLKMG